VSDISFRKILGSNQQTYQRLKLALSLNLRRQIFIAVCDDLPLRDRLVVQLQADLSNPSPIQVDRLRSEVGAQRYPRMVTVQLNPNDPNPIVQIAQWLAQSPPPRSGKRRLPVPAFQFLGVEQLTRQPAPIQRLFLTHLQGIERSLPVLDSTLLFWMPQPWFRTLPQSALEFWRCRTAVFEFIGDPTPLPPRPITQIEVVPHPQKSAAETVAEPSELPELAHSAPLLVTSGDKAAFSLQRLQTSSLPLSVSVGRATSAVVFDLAPSHTAAIATLPSSAPAASSAPATSITSTAKPTVSDPSTRLNDMEAIAAHLPASTGTLSSEAMQTAQLAEQIDALHQQQAAPTVLAEAYRILADLYRSRIERGDTAVSTLTAAIQTYEQVLMRLPSESLLWSDLLNDVGNLCWLLSRHTTTAEQAVPYLQQAIQTYRFALTKLNAETQAQNYPMIQNNLAAACADLARYENPAEHLEHSAQAYQEALRYRNPQHDPLRYASTQNNLGTTYWNLAQYAQPKQHLTHAIAAYSEALRYYIPDQDPLNYAMIQNNLGTAYWNLSQFEQAEENLNAAIAAYQIALRYRTPNLAAPAFAATQNNLGTAYWHLAICSKDQLQEQANHLHNAIQAYEAALLVAAQLAQSDQVTLLSFDPYTTHNNLGLAYHQLALWQAKLDYSSAHSQSQSALLEISLHHHLQAVQGWQHKSDLRQVAFKGLLQSLRTLYLQCGTTGQNLALSKIPAHLLPEIMAQL